VVHAENSDMIEWFTKDLEARGMTEPWHHGTSRPPVVEAEATNRMLALSEIMDCPILFVHVSAPEAIRVIREAQAKLLSIYAETCPHYMLLTGAEMRAPGFEGESKDITPVALACQPADLHVHAGAKACCAPPLRDNPEDRERVFEGLMNGALQIFSSDHAPTKYYDEFGKQVRVSSTWSHFATEDIPANTLKTARSDQEPGKQSSREFQIHPEWSARRGDERTAVVERRCLQGQDVGV
jgi:dihydropyrimidinase